MPWWETMLLNPPLLPSLLFLVPTLFLSMSLSPILFYGISLLSSSSLFSHFPLHYLNRYPVGYGQANLYSITISLIVGGNTISEITKRIGFRDFQIIEDPLPTGLSFYFKVCLFPLFYVFFLILIILKLGEWHSYIC